MNIITKLKARFYERKTSLRKLYYYNDELFHLAIKRYDVAVRERKHKTRLKALNLMINCYGAKMFRRLNGYSYQQSAPTSGVHQIAYRTQFKEQLKDADVVTFDIFDTLLTRKVSVPTDVFRVIECLNADYTGFEEERISAEKRARHLFGQEVTLDEIYSIISPKFRDLRDVELEYERRLLVRNDAAYDLYCEALKAGRRVAAISDMYLPSAFIRARLVEAGYTALEGVFVSGELKLSKCVNGDLFRHAADAMGLALGRILHVGDNEHSDFNMPRKCGCHAVHLPAPRQMFADSGFGQFQAPNNGSLANSIHNALIRTYRPTNNYFKTFGFMLGGPLALGYLTWLSKELSLSRADCALFVARDGWLLRKLYDKYFNRGRIRTGYVYLNRLLGLKGFTTYLDEPHYLRILLSRAHKDLGTPKPSDDYQKNLKLFNELEPRLLEWGGELKDSIIEHGNSEAGRSERIVTIDMGTGRFASLNFAKRIFGERLVNSFFVMTVNNYHEKLIYQAFLPYVATSRDTNVISPKLESEFNVMELMEILISSPEPRIIDIRHNRPIFDGVKDSKPFYADIAAGIEEYVENFLKVFEPTKHNVFSCDDWLAYAKVFILELTELDLNALAEIEFCAAADNETSPHTLFQRKN